MSRYDDFDGYDVIILQENSNANSYRFEFKAATSAAAKGSLPYDTQMTSAIVSGYAEDGTDVSTLMVDSSSLSALDEYVEVRLNYPGANGRYKLTFLLFLSDGSKWEKNFNRIEAISL